MELLYKTIKRYHKTLHHHLSFGVIPNLAFDDMEYEILQHFGANPPYSFYYQYALQLKMAKIAAAPSRQILNELSEYMIPLIKKLDNRVWVWDSKPIEVRQLTHGRYELLAEYQAWEDDDGDYIFLRGRPVALHFNDSAHLRLLLITHGYNATEILQEMEELKDNAVPAEAACIKLTDIVPDREPIGKCLICAIVEDENNLEDPQLPPHHVVAVWPGLHKLEDAIQELSCILKGVPVDCPRLRQLKNHVMSAYKIVPSDSEYEMTLIAFYKAFASDVSMLIRSRYFFYNVHGFIMNTRLYFRPENIDKIVEGIISFTHENN